MDFEIILILTVLGLVLIAIDFYLPGFVLGTTGIVLMIIALVVCAWHHSAAVTIALGVVQLVLGGLAAWASIKYFPRTKYGRKMILSTTLAGAQATPAVSSDLVGRTGVAHTVLRPAGVALIDGKRLDVLAESGMIPAGSTIRVVAVDGARVIVRQT